MMVGPAGRAGQGLENGEHGEEREGGAAGTDSIGGKPGLHDSRHCTHSAVLLPPHLLAVQIWHCNICDHPINDGSERLWTGKHDAPHGEFRHAAAAASSARLAVGLACGVAASCVLECAAPLLAGCAAAEAGLICLPIPPFQPYLSPVAALQIPVHHLRRCGHKV